MLSISHVEKDMAAWSDITGIFDGDSNERMDHASACFNMYFFSSRLDTIF